jgi:hypothetical protein
LLTAFRTSPPTTEVKEVEQVLGPEEEVAIDEFAKFEREFRVSPLLLIRRKIDPFPSTHLLQSVYEARARLSRSK